MIGPRIVVDKGVGIVVAELPWFPFFYFSFERMA